MAPAAGELACGSCGARYAMRDGIADLRVHRHDYYFNPVPRSEMDALVRAAPTASWDDTVRRFLRFVKHAPDWIDNVAVNGRYSWKLFMALPPGARFLDLGCGLGNLTQNVAPHVGEVVALDLTFERLQFAQQRFARYNARDCITLVAGGDGRHLPFPDHHFDAIALSGVLEWIADDIDPGTVPGSRIGKGLRLLMTFFGERNPRRTQQRFLRELARILKPDGQLFVAIENRWGYEYFLGRPDHHSGLPAGSLLPRLVANAYSIVRNRRPYRTYTHSFGGLRRLFRAAGLPTQEVYGLAPGYSKLTEIVPVATGQACWQPAPRERFAERFTHGRYLVPAFGIIAQRSPPLAQSLASRLLALVAQQAPDLGALTIAQCRITGKDKVVLMVRAGARDVVLKVPADAVAAAGESQHHRIIGMLTRHSATPRCAPVPLGHGAFQGLTWFLETRLAGTPLVDAGLDRDAAARQVLAFVMRFTQACSASASADAVLARLVDPQLAKLKVSGIDGAFADALAARLRRPRAARWQTGLAHGDLSANNLFVEGGSIAGAIDWEYADEEGLPPLDLIGYLESRQRRDDPAASAGTNLVRLARWDWPIAAEVEALRQIYARCGVDIEQHETLCLVAWLAHVGHQLDTSRRFDDRAIDRLVSPVRSALAARQGGGTRYGSV